MGGMRYEPIPCIHGFIQLIIGGKNSIIFDFSKCSTIGRQREQTCKQDWVPKLTKNIYSKSFASRVIADNSNIVRVIDL